MGHELPIAKLNHTNFTSSAYHILRIGVIRSSLLAKLAKTKCVVHSVLSMQTREKKGLAMWVPRLEF